MNHSNMKKSYKLGVFSLLMITLGASLTYGGTDKSKGAIDSSLKSMEVELKYYLLELAAYSENPSIDIMKLSVDRGALIKDLNDTAYVIQSAYPRVAQGHITDPTLNLEVLTSFKSRFDSIVQKLDDASSDESSLENALQAYKINLDPIPSEITFNEMPSDHETPRQ